MNYINKLKKIGFKSTTPIVIREDDRRYHHGYVMYTLPEYIKIASGNLKITAFSAKAKKILDHFIIKDSNISGTKEELSKVQSYKLEISKTLSIYITILKTDFVCFLNDDNIELVYDKEVGTYITFRDDRISRILSGKLDNNFWKNIINSLPKQYKRELVLYNLL